jgi:hypothetical protein
MSPFEIGAGLTEIPVGRHNVTIVEARAFETKDKGTPGIALTLVDDEDRELETPMWVTRAAQDRLEELWTAAGLEWPSEGGTIDEADLVGKRVHVELVPDEYQGKSRTRVHMWSPMGGTDLPGDTTGLETEKGGEEDDSDLPF